MLRPTALETDKDALEKMADGVSVTDAFAAFRSCLATPACFENPALASVRISSLLFAVLHGANVDCNGALSRRKDAPWFEH